MKKYMKLNKERLEILKNKAELKKVIFKGNETWVGSLKQWNDYYQSMSKNLK